jgi:hypothetical protein
MTKTRASHRLMGLLAAFALLAALPAVASAGLRLETKPDPAAPAGKAPKVIFTLFGTAKGRYYKVSATQVSGQNPLNEQGYPVICKSVVGRPLHYQRSAGGKLVLKADPSSYELGSNASCRGTYKGKVELKQAGGRPPKVLMTFRLGMPSMRLTHVSIPRR